MAEQKAAEKKARRVSLSHESRNDPGMLWQSYKAARLRKEAEVARERLSSYIRVWLGGAQDRSSHTPMISVESDPFGLLQPSIAFSVSGDSWLLVHRPSGILAAIEDHLNTLTQQLDSNKMLVQLSSREKGPHASCSEALQQSLELGKTLAGIAGCVENYAEVKSSRLMTLVMKVIPSLWKLVKARLSEKNLGVVLESLSYFIAFLHSILDPKRYWRKGFTRHQFPTDSGRVSAMTLPARLETIFLDVFIHQWEGQGAEPQEWHFLQVEVLHMLGAVLCGSEENASHMVTSEVCFLLLTILDPRERCTPLQALATKVITKVVHTLHNFIPSEQQTSVDGLMVLSGFLNFLSPRHCEGEPIPPCIRLVTVMLDTVPALMRPPGNAVGLKNMFVEVGCFEKFTEVLKHIRDEAKENASEACKLVCSVFRAFTAVMESCQPLRQIFETRVGYSKLCDLTATIVAPNTVILQEALNMVVEGNYKYREDSHSIYNTSAVAMLARWLLSLPSKLQPWLVARLYDICSYGTHNWQRCCNAGLLKVAVEVLTASQEEGRGFSEEVEEYMILLLEVLGSHSIRAAELKQVIGALRPLEDGRLPTYYYRLQKALSMMAHGVGTEGLQPLHYFDLRQSGSNITIPGPLRFPSAASFVFHAWVCLDHPHTKGRETYLDVFSNPNAKKRRVLYSFYTPSGVGFEAFFTDTLILVVATATRREFVTVALREHPISPSEWHSVCIIHSLAKKPWAKSEVFIYVDGDLKRTTALKTHGISDAFTTCHVGYAPSRDSPNLAELRASIRRQPSAEFGEGELEVSTEKTLQTIPFGNVLMEWGRAVNLRGQISSMCLFFESLSATSVRVLYKRGPNDLSLFQPKCPETRELGGKLLLYYHAKACKDGVCKDLSPLHVAENSQPGRFRGDLYITLDIKAVLSSLGGVELLFPILEQVNLPVKKRQCREAGKRKVSGEGEGGGERKTSKAHSPSPVAELPSVWWFDEKEGIASFLRLLLSMLSNSPTNQQVFFLREGPATIGALLQKVSSSQLTVQALQAVQELVEQFNHCPEWKNEVYRHLLFDFRIWSRPLYDVKIGHTQYISTIVKSNTTECRRSFGVQFMLDVIRIFYSSMGSTVSQPTVEGAQLTEEEQMSIRAAIISNVKLYVMIDIRVEELEAILSFVAVASDSNLQEELLRLLLNLLNNAPCRQSLRELLWAKGFSLLVLIQAKSMAVRLLAIKLISKLSIQPANEDGPLYNALHRGGLSAAIGQMTQHELSSSIILALLELCVTKRQDNYTDFISNLQVYLAVLQLLRNSPLDVRHTICQQVISILQLNPGHVVDIASSPGWESLFLWLLTPFEQLQEGAEEVDPACSITYKRLQVQNIMKEAKMEGDGDTPEGENEAGSSLDEEQERGDGEDSRSSEPDNEGEVPAKESEGEVPAKESEGEVPAKESTRQRRAIPKMHSAPQLPAKSRTFSTPRITVRNEEMEDSFSAPSGSDKPYRTRTNAFLDASTMGDRPPMPNPENLLRNRRSLTYSTSWTKAVEEKGDEIWRTFAVVTETVGYILWHSVDYEQDKPPWKVWGRFFASLDDFASKHTLVISAYTVKDRIFSLLMNAITLDTKAGITRSFLLEVVLQLCQMFESFALSSYPRFDSMGDEKDVALEKLSSTFMPDLDPRHCSTELLEQYLKMLEAVGIIEGPIHSGLELEIAQSATRVLLACTAMEEKEYYVMAALKLQFLLRSPSYPRQEVFFILAHLNRIITEALENGEKERPQYLAAVIRGVFSNHLESLGVSQVLPQLPDSKGSPSFATDFLLYSRSEEWRNYAKNTLTTELFQYRTVLLPFLHKLIKQGHECYLLYNQDERLRKEVIFQDQRTYQEDILSIFFELREHEREREKSLDSQGRNELAVILQRWRGTHRFFTGERGAWSLRKPELYLWKMDRTENFSRMRMKLARNYNCNKHTDASQLRDLGTVLPSQPQPDSSLLERLKVTGRSPSLGEEEDHLEQLAADVNSPGTLEIEDEASSKKEESIRMVVEDADLITLMERHPGRLEITTKHIYFFSDQHDKKDLPQWYSTDFKVPLSQLREIHSRRYNMSRTALEIFLVDQTNYFINFPDKKTVTKVYSTIIALNTPSLNRVGIRTPTRLLQASGLTQKWVRHEISNFDYLMQLNTIAGRTYNDLNQYPIFPWVLRDYSSDELDLDNPEVYRDFSRPMGIQNDSLIDHVVTRYEELDDPTIGKFHFGSHYSNAAGVMHFLIRLEPFTTLHIDLQSGKFDYADRQFFSILSTYQTIYQTGTDVKELIPEFFYLPEFLKNLNGFDLGKLQTGEELQDVILPKWASSPEDFIQKHRDALESKYVSEHLHEWIDLIFGYKQIGPEAVKACNIFNYYTYEQNVNLESIENPKERRQIESIINNFGQTPTQLFTEPHPLRQSTDLARKNQAKGYTSTFAGRRALTNLFEHLHDLKAHCVDISSAGKAVVFVGTPSIQTRALIVSGNPEQLVTLTECGLLNVHGWLPFSTSKHRPFTFQFDPNAAFDKSQQYVGGPFAQDLTIYPHLFVLSANNKLLATGGHWDNSFRVYSVERGKLASLIAHHNDIVTCMALDKASTGDHLITGSRDTTCAIWKFGTNESFNHPMQTLYGHDSEVLCVDISTELDMAVSGAKDGTCIIHTVRHGRYTHTLHPREGSHCEIHKVSISGLGRIVVYSEDPRGRSKNISTVPPCLHVFNINGELLQEKELSESVNDITIVDKYLITGNARGFLAFRDLYSLKQLTALNLLAPIRCLSVVRDHHTKVCTHLLVGLENGKLIIVSVKDQPLPTKGGS